MSRSLQAGVALLFLICPSIWATTSNFSFTGNFNFDTDLQFFSFTLLSDTPNVTLRTWSYVGGTNAAGDSVAGGGFEPFLNLYTSDGTQMNPGPSGPCHAPTGDPLADLGQDPVTGGCGDVYYPTTLSFPGGTWTAGTYIVVLSLYSNAGIGNLSDGFFAEQVAGVPPGSNYSCQVGPTGVQGSPPTIPVDQPFCDEFLPGTERDGHWALDILGVDSAVQQTDLPEPGSLSLGLLGGLVLLAKRLRSLS